MMFHVPIISAQTSKDIDLPDPQYYLHQRFIARTSNHYTVTEKVNGKRFYADSLAAEYSTETTYYVSIKVLGVDKDRFANLRCIVDSAKMVIKENDRTFSWNSNAEITAKYFHTLPMHKVVTAVLNKDFDITISPYGEVTKFESEQLAWTMRYIAKAGDAMPAFDKFLWVEALSQEHLTYLVDPAQNMLPYKTIPADSSFQRPISTFISNVHLTGNATVKVPKFENQIFTLEGMGKNLNTAQKETALFGFNDFVTVQQVTAPQWKSTIAFTKKGFINSSQSSTELTFVCADSEGKTFKEQCTFENTFTLTGQFNW
jgi:hypothetical protein